MPTTSTPARPLAHDDPSIDDDVSLEDDDDDVPFAHRSRTDLPPGGAVIYPHCFSARYMLKLPKPEGGAMLGKIGWHPGHPTGWTSYVPKAGYPRHVIKGTAWLVHTAPRNKKHLLTRFNSEHKTRLYGIAIEETADHYEVDLLGVRIADVKTFFEDILGLTASQYILLHYRQAERYVVLDPYDAFRLAQALGGQDRFGGGRLGRKRFLIKELVLDKPISIRARAKAFPVLSLYRIEPGATAPFRLEVRLRGRRATRAQFHEKDIPKLDGILLGIVQKHGLTTVLKPTRWEPRSKQSPVECAPMDAQLGRIPIAAYRGRCLTARQLEKLRECHTPRRARFIATSLDDGTFPPPRRVSAATDAPTSSSTSSSTSATSASPCATGRSFDITAPTSTWSLVEGGPTAVTLYRQADGVRSARRRRLSSQWAPLTHEITSLKGYLSEVVLDAQQPPMPFIEELIRSAGCKVGVGAVAIDTWLPLISLIDEHPIDFDIGMLVLFFDVSITAEVEDPHYLFDETTMEWVPRPGVVEREGGKFDEDPISQLALPLGATYWHVLANLRDLAEKCGITVVLVTSDFRKPTGMGEMRKTHYFTDARVRSLLGDATRYWCHQRYRVEGTAIVTLKDEAEGKTGRPVRRR